MKSYLTRVRDKKIRNGYITWETRVVCDKFGFRTKSKVKPTPIFSDAAKNKYKNREKLPQHRILFKVCIALSITKYCL